MSARGPDRVERLRYVLRIDANELLERGVLAATEHNAMPGDVNILIEPVVPQPPLQHLQG